MYLILALVKVLLQLSPSLSVSVYANKLAEYERSVFVCAAAHHLTASSHTVLYWLAGGISVRGSSIHPSLCRLCAPSRVEHAVLGTVIFLVLLAHNKTVVMRFLI